MRRSLELANVLRRKGIPVTATALIPDIHESQKLSSVISSYDICVQSLDEIKSLDASGLILDVHTDLQAELLPWLQQLNKHAVALDWYHDTGGVVIEKANLRGGAEALQYAIIRKEFQDACHNRSDALPGYDAVVVLGGGDSHNHLYDIFCLFTSDSQLKDKNIVLVIGQMVEGALLNLDAGPHGSVLLLQQPDNIADIMANARVAITNGGTTLMEFTMLGIPSIIFPQSEQERAFVSTFLEKGCGVLGSFEPGEFRRQITELWNDECMRDSMSQKARELIDGQGADRIANLVYNTFTKGEYIKK